MTDDQRGRAHNDHNVYILGAGFAAEAGLPLIKGFTNRMRDAAAWLEEQVGRKRELEAISHVLKFRLKAAGAAHRVPLNVENIEELFSLGVRQRGRAVGGRHGMGHSGYVGLLPRRCTASCRTPILSDRHVRPRRLVEACQLDSAER